MHPFKFDQKCVYLGQIVWGNILKVDRRFSCNILLQNIYRAHIIEVECIRVGMSGKWSLRSGRVKRGYDTVIR